MTTFASLWWLWLILTVLNYGYVAITQIIAFRRLWDWKWGDRDYLNFKVLGSCIIASLVGYASFVALVLSLLYHLEVFLVPFITC